MPRHLYEQLAAAVQKGTFANSLVLSPLSALWRAISAVRNKLYDFEVLPIYSLNIPVISVGNIVAGGTGKTPLVHLLTSVLQKTGPIAILSRGYLVKQSGLALGDEGGMLQRKLPNATVLVGKDRIQSGRQAETLGARAIVLDDGFQYRKLKRDFDIIAINGSNPFGFGEFLPRGLLRDAPERLEKADAIVVTNRSSEPLRAQLRSYTDAPQIEMHLECRKMFDLHGIEKILPPGAKVGLFCAIGYPQGFLTLVKSLGFEIVCTKFLSDHRKLDNQALNKFAAEAARLQAKAILCTEKDAIKLVFNSSTPLPILYLDVQFKIDSGFDAWGKLIEKMILKMNNCNLK